MSIVGRCVKIKMNFKTLLSDWSAIQNRIDFYPNILDEGTWLLKLISLYQMQKMKSHFPTYEL